MVYEAEARDITLAFAGDAMINRKMSPFREPQFLQLVELLRGADASIANLEQLFHNREMSYGSNDTISYQVSDPENLEELKWMGFDAVSTAMNHAYDYGEAGFLATLENCKKYGLPQAGGGINLGEARAPVFLDTPRGRVALMAAGTTAHLTPTAYAGEGRPDFPGKPGINALRHSTIYRVPREAFEAAKTMQRSLHLDQEEEAGRAFQPHMAKDYDPETEVHLFGRTLRLADDWGVETKCNQEDLQGISNWIRGAKKAADWVAYGVHFHESNWEGRFHGGSRIHPADFMIEFAHFLIDQGCDVMAGHGSHFLRGIEIYKGKPIFYSLGNFIFQNETVQRVPPPGYSLQGLTHDDTPGDWGLARSGGGEFGFAADQAFYRSAVPVVEYRGGRLSEIRLYPIDLGFQQPMSQRGRPVLAEGPVAQEILTWLQEVSRPFGTEIAIEGTVGVIRQ